MPRSYPPEFRRKVLDAAIATMRASCSADWARACGGAWFDAPDRKRRDRTGLVWLQAGYHWVAGREESQWREDQRS